MIRAAWAYRYFVFSSIVNEFRTRFTRSLLGGFWMILHPLAQVAIYSVVLSAVLSSKLPGIENRYAYAIYLMSGTLAWSLLSEVLGRCSNVFIDNGNLLKKMAFPKIALPIIVTGSALVSNVLVFVAIVIVFAVLGHFPAPAVLWLPVLTLIALALAVGFGLTLGIINVVVRDVGQLITIVLQFWFWLTPVVYTATMLPVQYQDWLLMNPMTGIVMGYQNILVYGRSPELSFLAYPTLLAVMALGLALFLYRRASDEMVDAL